MESLSRGLQNAEPLDLGRITARWGGAIPYLVRLKQHALPAGGNLLERTQALMDAVLDTSAEPGEEAPSGPATPPWWSAMPASYIGAFGRYAAVAARRTRERPASVAAPPPARAGVPWVRELLRDLGLSFVDREHAATLLAHLAKTDSLPGGGAPAEAYMRLSCSLDLRALSLLRRCELRVSGEAESVRDARLDSFEGRLSRLGILGQSMPPPLSAEQVRDLGFRADRERHRAMNALRYFRIVARMTEVDWHMARLTQERAQPRGRLHLLIGPAGCGKSSWAQQRLGRTAIVSSDEMRRELTGDPADQSQNYLVFQRCMDRVRELLRQGKDVTFDATNCTERLRAMPVQAARWSGAEIISYFFDVGLESALGRNRQRERSVPERVIVRQYHLLEMPAIYEADRQYVVDAEGRARLYWPVGSAFGAISGAQCSDCS
jgi:predicted kinase